MNTLDLPQLSLRLRSMTVFRNLLADPVLAGLLDFLACPPENTESAVAAYAEFVARLYQAGYVSLTDYIKDRIDDSENVYIRTVGAGHRPSPLLAESALADLSALEAAASLDCKALAGYLDYPDFLPRFESHKENFRRSYQNRADHINQYGYGIYARYHVFCVDAKGSIVPVGSPDPVRLEDLIDYQREKEIIVGNTLALLEGKPAANMLLTGDAGTGKSSTVKAVANEYKGRGLRILEVRKEQLHGIPSILAELNENPLKFILFIDDLSFQKDDDNFSALKAMLEGSVSAKSKNVVIYATSNRRHLVKERFSDRDVDEVHRNDAMQETVSLSERFGLRVTFLRPDKATYLNIVRRLAQQAGLEEEDPELLLAAERFALNRSARSARAARQFIDSLLSGGETRI